MASKLKTYRTFKAAMDAAKGGPIIRVGDVYLVGPVSTITEIALIVPQPGIDPNTVTGRITGHVTLHHLARLGNANHAPTAINQGTHSSGIERIARLDAALAKVQA